MPPSYSTGRSFVGRVPRGADLLEAITRTLAIGFGEGAELRRPLGIAIVGGLIASQLLTLLTTPVVYLYLDKLRRRGRDERHLGHMASAGDALPDPR
jgi:hypothetical protein